jgi:hypothetical protein
VCSTTNLGFAVEVELSVANKHSLLKFVVCSELAFAAEIELFAGN